MLHQHLGCIFTDGSSFGNPGPAGYGVTYKLADNPRKYISQFIHHRVSNNVAELHGILGACKSVAQDLRDLPPEGRDPVFIFVDNQFAINAANGKSKIRANKPLVALVQRALEALRDITPTTLVWVPGHAGIGGNELADALAKRGAKGINSGHPPHIPQNKHPTQTLKRKYPSTSAPIKIHTLPNTIPPNDTDNNNNLETNLTNNKRARLSPEKQNNHKDPKTHDPSNPTPFISTLRRSKRNKPPISGVEGVDFQFFHPTRKKSRKIPSTPLTCPHGNDYDFSNANSSVDMPHNSCMTCREEHLNAINLPYEENDFATIAMHDPFDPNYDQIEYELDY